ncbi:MAG: DNA mismatch repair protein MutS [Phycisphaeraceae bacterium]|nr:DNA mismatch repair protein MutS [Phycisphaeraceae bacterium]
MPPSPPTSKPAGKTTPAMAQYERFKQRHPDCVLFFRMGDFYEMFNDDAVTVSRVLGLTLTQRSPGQPMAGVPHHQLEVYLRRALEAGLRVAICDQVQDPKDAKGVVARAVTRVCTPGTLVEDALLAEAAPSVLACAMIELDRAVAACADVSTGAFEILETKAAALADTLARRGVRELLVPESPDSTRPDWSKPLADFLNASITPRPSWHFRAAESTECLRKQFGVATFQGFGLRDDDPALRPAGALLRYLQETQLADERDLPPEARAKYRGTLGHLRPPRREDPDGTLVLDAVSLRALEVERTLRGGGGAPVAGDASLLGVMLAGPGGCRTAMGKRTLRDWLCAPSANLDVITRRHAGVAALVEDRRLARELADTLAGVQDVARIAGRVSLGRAGPRDIAALGRSLARLDAIGECLRGTPALEPHAAEIATLQPALAPLADTIATSCVDDPPSHLREGGLFRDGIDAALDEARLLQRDAGQWLAAFQARIASDHALTQAKVGFNQVFGYYVELSAAQAKGAGDALVAAGFRRKQTLKNAERYTNPELTEFEQKVTTAEARAVEREQTLFDALCRRIAKESAALAAFADAIGVVDALLGLGDKAHARGWVRPEMTDQPILHIEGGRHPVLDELLAGEFVANDITLGTPPVATDGSDAAHADASPTLALITGPNMAGKSTFIRQVALITLLAHAGSFVPADRATIALTDRIFTRVGADDALHRGQSTFMVEMTEAAAILNNATPRSLVILDEIGRGTSTLDGLSLAWAITEHLADLACPTLFATHYHELTELESRLDRRVRNLHVQVREWPGKEGHPEIVFLHRIVPGRADRSYGVHVARLAGLPSTVTRRATEVLESLAVHHEGAAADASAAKRNTGATAARVPAAGARDAQLALFTEFLPHPAIEEIKSLRLDTLSPLQAFDALRRVAEMVQHSSRPD